MPEPFQPPNQEPEPKALCLHDPSALGITFGDGTDATLTAQALRRACPCAHCVDEHTGERLPGNSLAGEDLRLKAGDVVGRYAVTFLFSDGHDTGIFTWTYLRHLADGGVEKGGSIELLDDDGA